MLVVVPVEEARRPLVRLHQALEAFGIVGPILQGLELRLGDCTLVGQRVLQGLCKLFGALMISLACASCQMLPVEAQQYGDWFIRCRLNPL